MVNYEKKVVNYEKKVVNYEKKMVNYEKKMVIMIRSVDNSLLSQYNISRGDIVIVKENTNIVQANFMIENRPRFTKDETRLYLTIIGAVNKDDADFKPLEIPVSEFADLWGMELKTAYNKIKTALRGLVQKEFFVEGINQNTGKKRFLSAAYLSMAAYEEGQGYATVEISQSFKPYLIALKEKYTQYVLENIMNLTTVNAIRNYELLKQYETLGVRIFTVEEYKKALKIEKKYSLNADLRRYVVEPAVEEINQNTDIWVDYEISGRGIKAKIKFSISHNKRPAELPSSEEIDENQMTMFDDVVEPAEHEYENPTFEMWAEACNFEFDQNQLEEIILILKDRGIGEDFDQFVTTNNLAKEKFLSAAYKTFKAKADEIEIETTRFNYFKGVLRNFED